MEINFRGNAEEDLRALHGRVLSGDMPGSRELLAILDVILDSMEAAREQAEGHVELSSEETSALETYKRRDKEAYERAMREPYEAIAADGDEGAAHDSQ